MVLNLRTVAVALVAVLFASGCRTLFPPPAVEPLPSAPAAIGQAEEQAAFGDGDARIAEVEVWRDREPVMHGAEPPCADLCARVRIATTGIEPGFLHVTELWVVREGRAERFGELVAEPDEPGLVVTGQRGPRLDGDARVSVVARLERSDGTARYVRSREVSVSVRE